MSKTGHKVKSSQ